jgi:cytochrome c556
MRLPAKNALKVLASAAIFIPSIVSADNQDVIDYREHIMKTLDEQTAAVGMILSNAVPGDNAAAHLQAIALTAQIALKAFEPKVPGGEAKPEVWSNWADFSKRMNEFAKNSLEAAALAKEKGYDDPALAAKIVDALPCKSCHDVYRKEKK